ncbi:MAG TPA: hypothetical protein VF116_09940 [Ktedonobacterales bacterium]
MITIDDYLCSMEKTFLPERARGKHAVLQYVFSGSQAGACYAVIDDGCLSVARGEHVAPTVTVYRQSPRGGADGGRVIHCV